MKPIPGFPDYYACEKGDIWSAKRKYLKRLKPFVTPNPYYLVQVKSAEGKFKTIRQHRLVALAYKGPPPDDGKKYDARHINGDKLDNRPQNLEWIEADAHRRLSAKERSRGTWKWVTPDEVREIRRLFHEEGMSKRAISLKFGRNVHGIKNIVEGKTHKDVT